MGSQVSGGPVTLREPAMAARGPLIRKKTAMVKFFGPRRFTIAGAVAIALGAGSVLLPAIAAAAQLAQPTVITARAVMLLPAGGSAARGDCPPPSAATASSTISAAEKGTMLQVHNQARAATNASPPLRPLAWDSTLANGAQGWANIIGPSKHSECHSGAWGQDGVCRYSPTGNVWSRAPY